MYLIVLSIFRNMIFSMTISVSYVRNKTKSIDEMGACVIIPVPSLCKSTDPINRTYKSKHNVLTPIQYALHVALIHNPCPLMKAVY